MAVTPKSNLTQKLFGPGPKRILSVDGGGVRGILAASILLEIERRLKRRSGDANFRLCDYFDLVGGTSTGSIIAAALTMGRSAEEIIALYQRLAPEVFNPEGANAGFRKPRFDADKLDAALARELGDHELGSPALKSGLAIFAKRIDTGSAWTLTNNPKAAYWEGPHGNFPSKRYPLRKLVLASAAAPTYFEQRRIRLIPEGEPAPPGVEAEGSFVDGGVAALNDPSLQLLEVATLAPYGFNWAPGDDRLLMVSVGTGYWRPALNYTHMQKDLLATLAPEAAHAIFALQSMIQDASLNVLTTLQALSQPVKPWRINRELGDMRGARLSPVPLLHFQRFDARLDDDAELRRLGLTYDAATIETMKNMAVGDDANLAHLREIGRCAGEDYFRRNAGDPDWEQAIFPSRFDPPWFSGPPPGAPLTQLEAMSRIFGASKAVKPKK